jgi:hypothetical protein
MISNGKAFIFLFLLGALEAGVDHEYQYQYFLNKQIDNPNDADLSYNVGVAQYRNGKYQAAQLAFERSIFLAKKKQDFLRAIEGTMNGGHSAYQLGKEKLEAARWNEQKIYKADLDEMIGDLNAAVAFYSDAAFIEGFSSAHQETADISTRIVREFRDEVVKRQEELKDQPENKGSHNPPPQGGRNNQSQSNQQQDQQENQSQSPCSGQSDSCGKKGDNSEKSSDQSSSPEGQAENSEPSNQPDKLDEKNDSEAGQDGADQLDDKSKEDLGMNNQNSSEGKNGEEDSFEEGKSDDMASDTTDSDGDTGEGEDADNVDGADEVSPSNELEDLKKALGSEESQATVPEKKEEALGSGESDQKSGNEGKKVFRSREGKGSYGERRARAMLDKLSEHEGALQKVRMLRQAEQMAQGQKHKQQNNW